jgi:hypothetical protein
MNDPVLDPRMRGSVRVTRQERTALPPQEAPTKEAASDQSPEERLTQEFDGRLKELEKRIVLRLDKLIPERIEPLLDRKLSAASPGAAGGSEATKEALTQVMQAVLFESGFLEKLVQRAVEHKLEAGNSAKALLDSCRDEIQGIVEKTISATLSGENVKVMIDDKFRAISLYLKGEVIPKAVIQVLKQQKVLA